MISAEKKTASAIGAKTARACDSCMVKRARWFCAADDAFLCHSCDALVHSANQLASRHDRLRLQTSSSSDKNISNRSHLPAWHNGFTRKARTPRQNKQVHLQPQPPKQFKEEQEQEHPLFFNSGNSLPVVPDLGSEDQLILEENEDRVEVMCRVPVFDPIDSKLSNEKVKAEVGGEGEYVDDRMVNCELDDFSGFFPSDADLAEFSADVESLFGNSLEDIQDTGLELDCCKTEEILTGVGANSECNLESMFALDLNSEGLNWNFDDGILKEDVVVPAAETDDNSDRSGSKVGILENKKNMFLRLNYEDVISAWASQGCPWTTGQPPNFDLDNCWPDFWDSIGVDVPQVYGEVGSLKGCTERGGDGGREARVLRYREKRRTRLFSKRIRYEVRKLNAEKRPRMKGRFVKRTSLFGSTAFPYV